MATYVESEPRSVLAITKRKQKTIKANSRRKKKRSAAQKAATRKMIAARKAGTSKARRNAGRKRVTLIVLMAPERSGEMMKRAGNHIRDIHTTRRTKTKNARKHFRDTW